MVQNQEQPVGKITFSILIALSLSHCLNDLLQSVLSASYPLFKDDLVLSADLSIDNTYIVEGLLGNVVIEIKDKKVRVVKENSPKNICSKEGYISDSTKPLICLPNKVVIKIVQSSDMDGVVY